jgi:LPXTG-motif cell wall-anchored protein
LPQTGSDAALQGLMIGLGLTAAGAAVIAWASRRRQD